MNTFIKSFVTYQRENSFGHNVQEKLHFTVIPPHTVTEERFQQIKDAIAYAVATGEESAKQEHAEAMDADGCLGYHTRSVIVHIRNSIDSAKYYNPLFSNVVISAAEMCTNGVAADCVIINP